MPETITAPGKDIPGIPTEWYKTREQLKEKGQAQKEQEFKSLSKMKAEQALATAQDKKIKIPSKFLSQIKNTIDNLRKIGHGDAQRLLHKLNDFWNSFYNQARKGNTLVPAATQQALIEDAASFDMSGDIILQLTNAFNEKYGEAFEREQKYRIREAFEIAAKLRKIASILLKAAADKPIVNAAKRYLNEMINLSELNAYKLKVVNDPTLFGDILSKNGPGTKIKLQYDGNISQDSLCSLINFSHTPFKFEGKTIEIIPEKMPESAMWEYEGEPGY